MGMCGPKGCGFSAVLVMNRVSISAEFGQTREVVVTLVRNRVLI